MSEGEFKKRIESLADDDSEVFPYSALVEEINTIIDEAKKDLEKRLWKAHLDAYKRHAGDTFTYDNVKVNVYAEWVKDWFGDAK